MKSTSYLFTEPNLDLTDNLGRNAFQIMLKQSLFSQKFLRRSLGALYGCVAPQSIDLQIDNKLVRIDAQRLEFLLVQIMYIANLGAKAEHLIAFNASYFLRSFEHFPNQIVLEQRKKRSYISSLLSKHEVNRLDPYNRKLFLRIRHGTYILNPDLTVKQKNEMDHKFLD